MVLEGREKCFSAGFDLKVFAGEPERVLEMLTLGATLAERVLSFPTPVVVACTGHAIAAGSFLALAADARVGADGPFQIGLSEVRIGMTVPWFAIELARGRLHPAHYDRAVICAAMYSPQEALTAGFLDEVVAEDELHETAMSVAGTLAELDPGAHAATKLRARADVLAVLRSAIETELVAENFPAAGAQA